MSTYAAQILTRNLS